MNLQEFSSETKRLLVKYWGVSADEAGELAHQRAVGILDAQLYGLSPWGAISFVLGDVTERFSVDEQYAIEERHSAEEHVFSNQPCRWCGAPILGVTHNDSMADLMRHEKAESLPCGYKSALAHRLATWEIMPELAFGAPALPGGAYPERSS